MSYPTDPPVVKLNLTKTENVDWTYEIERGSNKASGTISYTDDFSGWDARVPLLESTHPTLTNLQLKKISAKREEGDQIKVTLTYENFNPTSTNPGRPTATSIKRYHMEPTGGEEPALTSALFAALSDAEKDAANQLATSSKTVADFATATAALTSVPGILFISKIRKGIEAYHSKGLFWVEKFSTEALATSVSLSTIWKTTSSPPGSCPAAGTDRNWLRHPPTVTPHDDGLTWDIENRWELSLPGKWDPDFYPTYD